MCKYGITILVCVCVCVGVCTYVKFKVALFDVIQK